MTIAPHVGRGRGLDAARVTSLVTATLLCAGFLSFTLSSVRNTDRPTLVAVDETVVPNATRSLKGHFIENRGQVAEGIRYYLSGDPSVGFRDDGVVFVVSDASASQQEDWRHIPSLYDAAVAEESPARSLAYVLRFDGANAVEPVGQGRLPFYSNFFLGNDARNWRTDVPSYRQVVYLNLYEGIDLIYRPSENGVKYEFVVHPGANPESIVMRYEGIDSLQAGKGGISVITAIGQVYDSHPYAYQGAGEEVECGFVLRGALSYGFHCDGWVSTSSLVIDPLIYSTFLGGSRYEWGSSVAADPLGNAYVTGETYSIDFPVTPGAFSTPHNLTSDIFVAKLNPTGSALVYSTVFGGSDFEGGNSLALDASGNAFIIGLTYSKDFPTTSGAFDTSFNGDIFGTDAFVLKLNEAGGGLVYSTYLGGSERENGYGIKVDSAGCAYVVGTTPSSDFPVAPGAFDMSYNGGIDAFVAKLDPAGASLLYSTFLGGSAEDRGVSLAIDSSGAAYVTGYTFSSDFPVTPGAYATSTHGHLDVFVTKLNASGKTLDYSTFVGGSSQDNGMSIAIDSAGNAYVTGPTYSPDFPTAPGAFDRVFNGTASLDDLFVLKLDAAGSSIVYATYIGGGAGEVSWSIAVDAVGEVYLTGETESPDFPVTPGAFDISYNGGSAGYDAFVTKLDEDASTLLYSTYFGGSGDDQGQSINVDSGGDVYATGYTESDDFPTTLGALDTTFNGYSDAFVFKLAPLTPDMEISTSDVAFNPPTPVPFGTSVIIGATVHNIGDGNASDVVVRFHDGPPSASNQIGTDQTISFIQRSGGTDTASTAWSAGPPGMHDICVVADPDNTIAERNESNNQACATIEVLAQFMPDLTVTPSDVLLSPPPPFVVGSGVQITATVHNIGTAASGTTAARFIDGLPPSPQIGVDKALAAMSTGGEATVYVYWISSGPVHHEICVVADPDTMVAEANETNNVACIPADVVFLPDLAPKAMSTAPPSPFMEHKRVVVNVTVANQEDVDSSAFDTLLFDDSNGNMMADAGESIALVPSSSLAPRSQTNVSFDWTAHGIGEHSICAFADPPPGAVVESNETNNVACIIVFVSGGTGSAQVTVETNYKPLVATAFAIVLLLTGLWSSKRRPWKSQKGRGAVISQFLVTSLPFMLAEVATGVLSLPIVELRIPPVAGGGTAVDLSILIAGLAVAVFRIARLRVTDD